MDVLLDSGSGPPLRPSGVAEVSVLIAAAPPVPERVKGVHLVLAPGLENGGGELPAEEHPPVPDALAKVGVRAVRAVPAGLDPAALAAAAQVLEDIL